MAKIDSRRLILVATVGRPHGLKGEVRVQSFTQEPTSIGEYGSLLTVCGKVLNVNKIRICRSVLIVKFFEINNRDLAETFNGKQLFIRRSALPENKNFDDYYLEDLIGLQAKNSQGNVIGSVIAVHNFGAGDIIEIIPDKGDSIMVTFTKTTISDVNFEKSSMTVFLPVETE